MVKDKTLVRKIYKDAYCSLFIMRERFPDQKYIVWHRVNILRNEPIGWGSTEDEAWKYAADEIKMNLLSVLEK